MALGVVDQVAQQALEVAEGALDEGGAGGAAVVARCAGAACRVEIVSEGIGDGGEVGEGKGGRGDEPKPKKLPLLAFPLPPRPKKEAREELCLE